MGKLIIDNRASIHDVVAMNFVQRVIQQGRISKEGKQYCYTTSFTMGGVDRIMVYTDLNKRSDRFIVCDYPPKPLQTAKMSK